eukprot:18687-Eustigmatos_ZCMA.PRE.1
MKIVEPIKWHLEVKAQLSCLDVLGHPMAPKRCDTHVIHLLQDGHLREDITQSVLRLEIHGLELLHRHNTLSCGCPPNLTIRPLSQ